MIFRRGICKALIVTDACEQLKCSVLVFLPITRSRQSNKVVCEIGWFDLKYRLGIGMKGMLLPGFAVVMFIVSTGYSHSTVISSAVPKSIWLAMVSRLKEGQQNQVERERKRRWREGIPCVSSFAAPWNLGLTPTPSLVVWKIPTTARSRSRRG